jgi:hypothetical protein
MPDFHRRPPPLSRWRMWLRALAATAAAFSSAMLTSRSEALEADWPRRKRRLGRRDELVDGPLSADRAN